MKDHTFQELLEVETSLQKAQDMADANDDNTSSLQSHAAQLSAHQNFVKVFEVADGDLFTIDEIRDLLAESKAVNISNYCSKCYQCFFNNDKDAAKGIYKTGLAQCCLDSMSPKYDELEVSFWWFFIKNFHNCVNILPNYTRLMINQGVPSNLRSVVWGLLTLSTNPRNQLVDETVTKKLFESLNVDISEDIKIITNDINRTFPQLSSLRTSETKRKFERILNAFSIYNFEIGYCQGLQFIVAPLLFHFEQEEEIKTFNSLINLFDINPFLKKIYNDGMTNLNVFFYKFEKIFKKHSPDLSNHLKSLDLDFKVFLSQWFLSFYAVTMPFHFLIRMFDILLFEGVEATLLRVGITILNKNENLLMQIDNSELIYQHLLSENCWGVFGNNCDDFISSLLSLSTRDFSMENLNLLEMGYQNEMTTAEIATLPLPKLSTSFGKLFTGLTSKFPTSSSTSSISSSASIGESDTESVSSSNMLFSIKNNSQFSLSTNDTVSSSSNASPVEKVGGMRRSTKFQLLKVVEENKPLMKPFPRAASSDVEMMRQMYELCLRNNVEDPVLEKVKQRLRL